MTIEMVIALISTVITLVSLGGLLWSLRILARQTRSLTCQALYQHQLEMDLFLFEHLDVKQALEQNQPVSEDPEERARQLAIAEMIATLFEHVFLQRRGMPGDIWEGWKKYINDYGRKRMIRDYLETHKQWFTADFISFLDPENRHTH